VVDKQYTLINNICLNFNVSVFFIYKQMTLISNHVNSHLSAPNIDRLFDSVAYRCEACITCS